MEKMPSLNVLLIAEGSGGHLIPSLRVANDLIAQGAKVKLWYAERRQVARVSEALLEATLDPAVEVEPIALKWHLNFFVRLWYCGVIWLRAQKCLGSFRPSVVVGFGGWVTLPVLIAAKQRGVPILVHEQNVRLGRTNQLLTRWVNRIAISFQNTARFCGRAPVMLTGLPTRRAIGSCSREEAASRFGLSAERPTLLIVGGSQGAHAVNDRIMQALPGLSAEERSNWQFIHLTGVADEAAVKEVYATHGVKAFVAAFVTEMDAAYALADVVLARAGASTIAELAQCGIPAILIPYPEAGRHQRANAEVVEIAGGGFRLEEEDASPDRVLRLVRQLLEDKALRQRMGSAVRSLCIPDAAERVAGLILGLTGRELKRVPVTPILQPEEIRA